MAKISFPYGASYSPLIFDEGEWDRDLGLMRDSYLNLVRIGDVHGSWDRIEPRPGVYEFARLEKFYRKADQYGVQILLSNGASCPPLWLKTKYPDISLLSNRGERYPLGSSYHWACIHHPGYLEALRSYTTQLAEFAIQFSNHFGWQITNEIGFPFMPAREQNELGLYCYCDHCQDTFRSWLKDKYQSLEALTEAWSWSTTNFVYNDWGEVVGPESLPASWSGVTRWIDWRLFWQKAFTNYAGWQHKLLRKIDKNHPTSINTFNFKGFDRFGTFMGLDQWSIAKEVDHIGYDLYPGSGDKLKSRPEHNSMFLDHGRSVSLSTGKDFWLHEVESGPIGGWLPGPQYNTSPKDIDNYILESIGHNGKLIIYMPWREWGYQPIRWGALVDLNGNPTSRLQAAAKLGDFLQEQADFLKKAQTPQGEVAILESKPNAIFLRGVNQEELLFKAQRGAYRAFWDQGFSIDFITPDQLNNESLQNYKYICLPLLGLLGEAHAQLLEGYVSRGGIVIGFARLATLDDKGWYHYNLPLQSLGSIFGINNIQADTLGDHQIKVQDQIFKGAINRDLIKTDDKTETLATFTDGKPAVTHARLGEGFGVYIGTQADIAYLDNPQENLLREIIYEVNKRRNIQPRMIVNGPFTRANGIDPHLLEADGKAFVLISNYLNQAQPGEFLLQLGEQLPEEVNLVFPSKIPLPFTTNKGVLSIPLQFKEKEVVILEIIWN